MVFRQRDCRVGGRVLLCCRRFAAHAGLLRRDFGMILGGALAKGPSVRSRPPYSLRHC